MLIVITLKVSIKNLIMVTVIVLKVVKLRVVRVVLLC
jgi:hypothetical protein